MLCVFQEYTKKMLTILYKKCYHFVHFVCITVKQGSYFGIKFQEQLLALNKEQRSGRSDWGHRHRKHLGKRLAVRPGRRYYSWLLVCVIGVDWIDLARLWWQR
jgi:hypothetical protein